MILNRLTERGFDFDMDFVASHLQSWPIAQALKKLQQYEDAEESGQLVMLPFAPGTAFIQDEAGETDIVFTGEILFEVKSNEDTEFWDREEVVEELGPMKRR